MSLNAGRCQYPQSDCRAPGRRALVRVHGKNRGVRQAMRQEMARAEITDEMMEEGFEESDDETEHPPTRAPGSCSRKLWAFRDRRHLGRAAFVVWGCYFEDSRV